MDKDVILVEQQVGHIDTCRHSSPLSRGFRTLPICDPVVIQDVSLLKDALAQIMHAKSISKVTMRTLQVPCSDGHEIHWSLQVVGQSPDCLSEVVMLCMGQAEKL